MSRHVRETFAVSLHPKLKMTTKNLNLIWHENWLMPHQSDQGMTVVKMTDTLCLRGVSPVHPAGGEQRMCLA